MANNEEMGEGEEGLLACLHNHVWVIVNKKHFRTHLHKFALLADTFTYLKH